MIHELPNVIIARGSIGAYEVPLTKRNPIDSSV